MSDSTFFRVTSQDIRVIAEHYGRGKETRNGDNRWVTLCPIHGDKKPSLGLAIGQKGQLLAYCFAGCDYREVLRRIQADFPGLFESRHRYKKQEGKKDHENLIAFIWNNSKPAREGTRSYSYLTETRRIDLSDPESRAAVLGAFRQNRYKGSYSLAFPMRKHPGGEVEGVLLVHIEDGTPPKKKDVKFHGKIKGRACWIPGTHSPEVLIIAEGAETALSVLVATGCQIAIAGNASNLCELTIPGEVERVIVAVDQDPSFTGQREALRAARKYKEQGFEAELICPSDETFDPDVKKKLDFNDLEPDEIAERFKRLLDVESIEAMIAKDPVGLGGKLSKSKSSVHESNDPLPLTRELPQSKPFPVKALGPILSDTCSLIVDNVQAPEAMVAQSLLACAALSVQGLCDVVHIDGRTEPSSVFCLTVGRSGERKTAIDKLVLKPVRDLESAEYLSYNEALKTYELEKERFLLRRKKFVNKGGNPADILKTEPDPPLHPGRILSDVTFEAICKSYEASCPSKGLFSSEGGVFTGGHSLTLEKITMTAAGLSCFWDGEPINRRRATDGNLRLEGRRLSIHLMLQERVGAEFLNNEVLRDQGLLSRFLVAWPESRIGFRDYSPVNIQNHDVYLRYCLQIGSLLEKTRLTDTGGVDAKKIGMATEAQAAWIEFYKAVESMQAPGQPYANMTGFCSKAPSHALRLSAILQIVENPDASFISRDCVQNAVEIMKWYLTERKRISEAAPPQKILDDAQKLLNWIRKRKLAIVTLPDIYQHGPSNIRNKRAAEKTMSVLESHGYCEKMKDGPPVPTLSGTQSRHYYEINKMVFSQGTPAKVAKVANIQQKQEVSSAKALLKSAKVPEGADDGVDYFSKPSHNFSMDNPSESQNISNISNFSKEPEVKKEKNGLEMTEAEDGWFEADL